MLNKLWLASLLMLCLVLGLNAYAQVPPGSTFNHDTTGFPLDATHARQTCESCHVQGTFRGTPRDCSTCHRTSPVAQKPSAQHIPTSIGGQLIQCSECHTTITFAPSIFSHRASQGISPGSCNSCHSGAFLGQGASAKPATHVPTNLPCDSCHKSTGTSWLPAGYTHALVPPGTCATCHNGTKASGKSTTHIPTSASCDSCHAAGVAWAPVSAGVAAMHSLMSGPVATGNCATCHGGAFLAQNAQAKPATHIPTSLQCDACHISQTTWATAPFDHASASPPATGRCSTCHNSTQALGKPSTHVPTSAQCDSCHTNYIAFKPAQMNHGGTDGQCATCHNGSFTFTNALGKPTVHIPTSTSCDTCHVRGFANWSPATMNHAGTAGKCITCHSGGFISQNAQTKPTTHVATTAQCDSCHASTTSWATVSFNHGAATPPVAGRCSSCHNSSAALGKPVSHIPTSGQCDTCHNNFTAFKPAQMNHTGLSGQCSTCHSGSYSFANAQAKPVNHIPTSTQCDSCHTSGFVAWSPSTMNHAATAGLCSACHSGTYLALNAQTKTPTHIQTTAQCDACHRSTTTWATVTFDHATASPAATGRCSQCHNGTTALGKSITHIPTGAQCDTCHRNYAAFAPAVMSHTGTTDPLAAGNCATCHSGAYTAVNARVKPATHVITTQQCDTCHASTVNWTGATYTHDAAANGSCSTCHNGTTALGKSATHIPTTAQCDTCHNNFVAFRPAVMNHVGTAAQCSTCHGGAFTAVNALAKPVTHIPTAVQCDSCHNNFVAFKPARMNHTGAAAQCSTCHNGSYVAVNALAKSVAHIPTSGQCDTCHVNGFVNWSPATMNHTGLAGQCATCHGGAYVSQNAQTKTATHIPTTAQCDSSGCHTSTVSWATVTLNHATVTPSVVGRCTTCHNGTNALGKPTNHVPTTAQCDTCHLNFMAFAPATMSHAGTTGPVAAGNCATCHSGTYVAMNAQTKPVTHIVTTAQCDNCHATTVWKPTSFSHQGVIAGTCVTCHNGTNARGKAATHLPTAAVCDVCHTNYISFAPATMAHAGTSGPAAAGNCATCHSGAYLGINAQIKPATHVATAAQCDTCHTSTTTWALATYTHDGTAPGRCATCHNGTTALGKPTNHVPTSVQCDTCHKNYVAFRPAQMDHTGTTAQCSTCHNGSYLAANALTKPATHIPTSTQCDTCHRGGFTNWSPATMNHTGLAGQCSTCHGGAYVSQNAQTKTATHIPTTAQCDSSGCHASTVTWAMAAFNHTAVTPPVTGRCATCHNGTNALGRPTNHIPTTAQCDTCHRNFAAFAPATMSHTGTTGPLATGNCATCHSGAYTAVNAQAKPVTHIPTAQSCDICHTTVAWRPTSFSHQGVVAGSCATCHNGTTAAGKPAGSHIPTSQSCDVCHRTGIAWLPLITPYAHTGIAAGTCTSCHSGSYQNIDVKPANHMPTAAQCDACHRSFNIWTPVTSYTHAGVATGTCQSCHGGTYPGVMTKPAGTGHIPTTVAGLPGNECSYCHTSTSSFAVERMNHGTIQTSCVTCHDQSSPYPGTMDKINRGSHHSAGSKDCSSSGCHKPLGSKGRPYTKWD